MLNLGTDPHEKTTLIVVSLILLLIQIMFGPQTGIFDAHPNFMLLLACMWGFSRGSESGVIAGFLSGLAYDIMVNTPFGLMTLVLTIAGFLSGLLQRNLISTDPKFAVLLTLGLSILAEFVVGIFIFVFGLEGNIIYALFGRMIASSIYTSLCAIPLVFILNKFMRDSQSSQLGTRYK